MSNKGKLDINKKLIFTTLKLYQFFSEKIILWILEGKMKELYLLLLCMVTTSLGKNKSVDLELDYETGKHLRVLVYYILYI